MKDSFTIIYPDGKVEKKVSQPSIQHDKALTKTKKKVLYPKSFKHFLGAFTHAIHWEQLKDQLRYPVLLRQAKKRWYIGAGAAALFLFFMFPRAEKGLEQFAEKQHGQHASVIPVSTLNSGGQDEEKHRTSATPVAVTPQTAKEDREAIEASIPIIPEAKRKENALLKELGRHAKELRDTYIKRYAKIAKGEQQKFGIPASITLGLAILQSDFGTQLVAEEGKNHLMVSCDKNPIPMGKGMTGQGVYGGICYTRYESVWMSFRAHSEMLKRNYAAAFQHSDQAYKKWAKTLEDLGYFQSNLSADILIQTIENYQLKQFDTE